jgi:mannose-6-phosphate isomerase
MTVERAVVIAVRKPWGSTDLRPWSQSGEAGSPIGELWFERADRTASEPALLLKLLFTEQPLSIQVHPDDAFARSIGLPHGKTEAWYIVAADPGAQIALGLERVITSSELRRAIEDGSIAGLVHWQDIAPNEAVLVPAGTIHAIGAGLVIAEIQQRSDATFRMFDYERHRELHVDNAVGVAIPGPAGAQPAPLELQPGRRVLASSAYFVLEHIDLPADSRWEIDVEGEAWLLVLSGETGLEAEHAGAGDGLFIDAQLATCRPGATGLKCLLAYVANQPFAGLLRRLTDEPANLDRLPTSQELPL